MAATQPRFEGQGDRTVDAIRRATGASGDTSGVQEALKEAARKANRPAYERAYSQGRQVWSQELADITSAPAVQTAIREATARSRNVAAGEGARPIKNSVQRRSRNRRGRSGRGHDTGPPVLGCREAQPRWSDWRASPCW